MSLLADLSMLLTKYEPVGEGIERMVISYMILPGDSFISCILC